MTKRMPRRESQKDPAVRPRHRPGVQDPPAAGGPRAAGGARAAANHEGPQGGAHRPDREPGWWVGRKSIRCPECRKVAAWLYSAQAEQHRELIIVCRKCHWSFTYSHGAPP